MKKLSLNIKITFVLMIAVLGAVGISVVGIDSMEKLDHSLKYTITKSVPRIRHANRVRSNFRALALGQANILLENNKDAINLLIEDMANKDRDFREEIEHSISDSSDEAKVYWRKIESNYNKWWDEAKEGQKLALAGDDKGALHLMKQMAELRKESESALQALIDRNDQIMKEEDAAAEALYLKSRNLVLMVSLGSIFISALLAFLILRAMSKSIQLVIKTLSEGSIQVSTASQQIASASEELSQAAAEQAASLEETAASVEEMNSMIAKNSENASSAATTSSKSQETVTQGKRIIEKMIQSMDMINKSSEGMIEVVRVIEQIDKKTKVINDIVHKTELLSFNASVEAARAGEHGKGFAVVAEEVGNLARMSGLAAEEIGALLENSITKVNQMVTDTKRNVETGSQVTHECGAVFEEVVKNVTAVSGMATEISSASQEQARGCSEITKAMNQLDQMTQQNASTSEECAQSAEELSAQSESLKNAVTQLVLTINGGSQNNIVMSTTATQTAFRPAAKHNVIHMKTPRTKSAHLPHGELPVRKAANQAPNYDSDGFRDV